MKNIAFITLSSGTHRTAEENIGIGYMASILRMKDYNVSIIDGWLYNLSPSNIIKKLISIRPILFIGFSCYALSFDRLKNLIEKIKKIFPNTPIIAGGYGPTFHDEQFLKIGFNYVVRGEGEDAILKIANSLSLDFNIEKIDGLSFLRNDELIRNKKVNVISDLDSIPFPSRDTIRQTKKLKNPVHLVTSRGCYGNCNFCSINSFYSKINNGNKWRQRSIRNIIEEIKILSYEFGITCFKFLDDSFIEPPRNEFWVEKFANAIKTNNLQITFRTQIRADRLTETIAETLSDCGWFATSLGVENFSNSALKRMNKSASIDDNLNALHILEKNRIITQMGLILFDDKTTITELRENYTILKDMNWPIIKGIFTEMYAAQGTNFSEKLLRHGLITGIHSENLCYEKNHSIKSVYESLKKWQKSHCLIYDKAMNPLSAPKHLPTEGYNEYHLICMELYRKDINFLSKILDWERKQINDVGEFTQKEIEEHKNFYEEIDKKLSIIDTKYSINFDAQINPFL